MGLREMLERSALSSRLVQRMRHPNATSSSHHPAATPTPVTDEEETAAATPQHQEPKSSSSSSSIASSSNGHNRTAKPIQPKMVNTARLSQLVGENPPPGSLARVVKRKYQSVARERERVDMVEYHSSSSSSSSSSDKAHASNTNGHNGGGAGHTLLDAVEQYEVEFPKSDGTASSSLGIDLETDFYGKHTVVKQVKRGSVAFALSKSYIRPGHVVVAVNGRDLSHLSFEQVLRELKQAALAPSPPRVIRFVDPQVLPMKSFVFEAALVNRDQYGFAKDDKYILSYRKQLRKRKSMSYQHEKKWAEFVQRHGGVDALDERINSYEDPANASFAMLKQEFQALVLSGVPVVLRPRIWSILAGVTRYKKKFGARYFEMLILERETSPSVADIEKDVYRTYPEHPFFQTEKGKNELKNVLCAYSLHNPSVGYCQSMNFIAGMMLLFMNEEDAFWLLCVMMHKKYLPAENYTQSMLGTQADQLVFKWLVDLELPKVAARLELCGIQIQLVTLHWFLCAFVCTLPTETALRVWDWFFLDGEEVLFTVAIGILKLAEQSILGATTHSDLHTIVRGLGTDLHDEDELMSFLLSTMAKTNSSAYDERLEPRTQPVNHVSQRSVPRQASFAQLMLSKEPPSLRTSSSSHSLLSNRLVLQLFSAADSDHNNRTGNTTTGSGTYTKKFTMRDIDQPGL